MSTLSNPARRTPHAVLWRDCARCGRLFPADPGETLCPDCDDAPLPGARCGCAHPEDLSPCDGPPAAVRVVDQADDELIGCVHHASVVLASVEGTLVHLGPAGRPGDAVEAYQRAALRAPFVFDPGIPWPTAAPVGGGR